MARPAKDTVEYFPHYTTSGKTIFTLQAMYGNDGYAAWFKILEILGSSPGHYYQYENAAEWLYLVSRIGVSGEKTLAILSSLSDLGAINKDLHRRKIIWSQNFVDGLRPVYVKRSTDLPVFPSFLLENNSSAVVSGEKTPQSKVKESKGKKSKVEKDICPTFQESIAKELISIVSLRRAINVTDKQALSWSNTIRLMVEKDKIPPEQIKKVVSWYEENWMNEFVPVVESACSLRDKWQKLLNAIDRDRKSINGDKHNGFDQRDYQAGATKYEDLPKFLK